MENGHIVICGEDAHHMTHVLRMRCGESVVVCVPDTGIEYETTFVSGGDPVLERGGRILRRILLTLF